MDFKIESWEGVLLATFFVVPGFVFMLAFSTVVNRDDEDVNALLLRCFSFGVLNFSIFYLPLAWLLSHQHNRLADLLWFLAGTALPAFWGVLLGHSIQNGSVESWYKKVGLTFLHPVNNAWDRRFTKARESKQAQLLLVHLKDGKQVLGGYAENSFAGNGNRRRDIYLEMEYTRDKQGRLSPVSGSPGILIDGEAIHSIEFFNLPQ